MIGILLSESMELVITLGKLGYGGTTWLYNWYFEIPSLPTEEEKMEQLQKRIEDLEKRLEDDKSLKAKS